jgi:hypothetical protein
MVRGPAKEATRFKKQAAGHDPWMTPKEKASHPPSPLNFHSLVPIPENILQSGNAEAGHDWKMAHWGTKWGACDAGLVDESDGCLMYSFNTAWLPPIAFLENVCEQWPPLTFILEYDECGMGFKGIAKGNGEHFENHCVDY